MNLRNFDFEPVREDIPPKLDSVTPPILLKAAACPQTAGHCILLLGMVLYVPRLHVLAWHYLHTKFPCNSFQSTRRIS